MTDFPHVALLVITYDRYSILKETLYALQVNLNYPKDKLHVIVSDDSTGGTYLSKLKRIKAFKQFGANGIDWRSTDERSGWGKHVNGAIDYILKEYPQAEYVFQIEDDYKLLKTLDLTQGIGLLEKRQNIGMLRYRGTAGTHVIYHQFEANIADYYPKNDNCSYLQLDNASPTLWVYSNGPHLKRLVSKDNSLIPAFHKHYGWYAEGLRLGATEENFAHRVKDGMKKGNAPAIAILPDWVNMHFQHLGDSWQLGEHDIGTGHGKSS